MSDKTDNSKKKPVKAPKKQRQTTDSKRQKKDKKDTSTRTHDQEQKRTIYNKKRLLLELELTNFNVSLATKNLGLARSTHYGYCESDPDYKKACDDIEQDVLDKAEGVLNTIINNPHAEDRDKINAAKVVLSARGKDRGYGTERREQNHSGGLDVNNKVTIVRLPRNGREPDSNN